MRKLLAVCCLVAFCLATVIGCEKPKANEAGPAKKAPAQTTAAK